MRNEALLTFVVVHRTGTINGASQVLHRSQPAVSRRLQGLERSIGATLFDRTAAGLQLTSAGRVLLPYAEAALAAEADGLEAVREHTDQPSGEVLVAIVGSLATSWLTGALQAFAATHALVDLSIMTANSRQVCNHVRRGEAIAGITYASGNDPALSVEVLFDEELVVVCAPSHPLAGRTIRHLSDLNRQRWLVFPAVPGRPESSADHLRALLGTSGVAPEQLKTIDSLTAQKRLAEAGFGIAGLPSSAVSEELDTGQLRSIHLAPPLAATPVRLVTRSGGYQSRAARDLLRSLRLAARDQQPARAGGG